jgi:hypothetical protein
MIETVEIHFEGGSLPVLTRWSMRWYQQEGTLDEITALSCDSAGNGRRFHWNLPLMSICLALLRLEGERGGKSVLLRGPRGSAASTLAEICSNACSAGRLHAVLALPGHADTRDAHARLNRWFRVAGGPAHAGRMVEIWRGPRPPEHIVVTMDGEALGRDEFSMLESRLEWLSEERDWLGAVTSRSPYAAAVA